MIIITISRRAAIYLCYCKYDYTVLMNYHHILLTFHLLSAAIWVGGHILLLLRYAPEAYKTSNKHLILQYESRYEKIGLPALVILVGTGIAMAMNYGVTPGEWFLFSTPIERAVSFKLLLLFITVAFALSAQLKVIPKLKAGSNNLLPLLWHIGFVTTIGIIMLVLGSYVRFGGI